MVKVLSLGGTVYQIINLAFKQAFELFEVNKYTSISIIINMYCVYKLQKYCLLVTEVAYNLVNMAHSFKCQCHSEGVDYYQGLMCNKLESITIMNSKI